MNRSLLLVVSTLMLAVPCANAGPAPARDVTHGTLVSDPAKTYIADTAKPGRQYLRLDAYDLCYDATIRALKPGGPLAGWHAATTTEVNEFISAALSPGGSNCTIVPSSSAGVPYQCGTISNWIQGDFGDSYLFASGANEYDFFGYVTTDVTLTSPLKTIGFVAFGSLTHNYVQNVPASRCPTEVGIGCSGSLDNYKKGTTTNGINLLLYRDDGGAASGLNVGSEWCPAIFESIDSEGPIVSGVTLDPNPTPAGTAATLTATVDDTATGGSTIASAQYSIDGVGAVNMDASLSPFDNVTEGVTALVPGLAPGIHEVCVSGTDRAGNAGDSACILLPVYDPEGGFVTGGGWVDSPSEADLTNGASGKAIFGFVSKYLHGRSTPDGSLEFRFKDGDINFKSTSMEWLVVTGEPRAQFRGEGLLNNADTCKFEVDAWDASFSGGDAFGLKLFACGPQANVNRYALPATALGGGNIMIHKK